MRRTLAVLALIAASCTPVAPQLARAQQPASIAACVTAATTHDALWRCKGADGAALSYIEPAPLI